MRHSEHCARCVEKFGAPFERVHSWLDEFAPKDIINHRKYRHHKEGIEMVRKMWGEADAKAAELHIMDDWGFIPDIQWYKDNWLQ
jgi:hypothetical protein